MKAIFDKTEQLLSRGTVLNSTGIENAVVSKGRNIGDLYVSKVLEGGWSFQLANRKHLPWLYTDSRYQKPRLYFCDGYQNVLNLRLLIRTAFECRFAYEGIVSFHAACVELSGEAICFTGDSGAGKSTRAKAWVDGLGAEFISGDRPAIRLEEGGLSLIHI